VDDRGDQAQVIAAGRRCAADEIENLAIFESVFGEPLNFPLPVEINRDHALIGYTRPHEGDFALNLLRYVIEGLAADGGDRGGRAENQQDLFLRCAKRDLLERAFGQHVAALKCFAGAASERECAGNGESRQTRPPYITRSTAPHLGPYLAPSRRVPYPQSSNLATLRWSVPLEPAARTPNNPMILRRFRRSSQERSIRELYGAIVAQARSVAFYSVYGVPDTVEGRFDLIVLHIVLLLARLDRDGSCARGIGQKLFDIFCSDLDANLREMGVGDLAVPKRMRQFGEAFYGRQAAYLAAFKARDDRELENAFARNIFYGVNGDGAARLARYARAVLRDFEAHGEDALLGGENVFPKPEAVAYV